MTPPSPRRPSDAMLARARAALRPYEALTGTVYAGFERLPASGPFLAIGNHTLYGVLDVGQFAMAVWHARGVFLHGVGDKIHYKIPGWGDLLEYLGSFDGTYENASARLAQGASLLLFPGGGREVAKRKGERYQLHWKNRTGFARLALEHGVPIVPFASVGVEEMWDVVFDSGDLMASPVGSVLSRFALRHELFLPLSVGLWGTPLPRPERYYFSIGDPLLPSGTADDPQAVHALRERTRAAVQAELARLRAFQARDPLRSLGSRVRGGVYGPTWLRAEALSAGAVLE